MTRSIAPLPAVAAALAPLSLQAEEGGAVSPEIGGEAIEFALWAGQGDRSGNEAFASVNDHARPTDEASRAPFQTLTPGFTVTGAGVASAEPSRSRVGADGLRTLHAVNDAGGFAVTVDAREVAGGEMTLSGMVAGKWAPLTISGALSTCPGASP